MKVVKWTKEENDIIIKYYSEKGSTWIHENLLPNRTIAAINSRAYRLKAIRNERWTKEENDIIIKYYSEKGAVWLHENLLPNRTIAAIAVKGGILNLHTTAYKRWTKEENDIIIKYYSEKGAVWLHENLLIDRSVSSIYNRSRKFDILYLGKYASNYTKIDVSNHISDKELYYINLVLCKSISEIDAAAALKISVLDLITLINKVKEQRLIKEEALC